MKVVPVKTVTKYNVFDLSKEEIGDITTGLQLYHDKLMEEHLNYVSCRIMPVVSPAEVKMHHVMNLILEMKRSVNGGE